MSERSAINLALRSSHQFQEHCKLTRKNEQMFTNQCFYPTIKWLPPELDVSAPLDEDFTTWFQKLLGTLWWAVEPGHIDIHLSIAILAQYLVQPRAGQLDQAFHVFAYLKSHLCSRIVLDASKPMIDKNYFAKMDWQDFYPEAKEALPLNALEPCGNDVLISCFVDANHAGNKVRR